MTNPTAGSTPQRPQVRTFIRAFSSNSQAAHVETDQGEYIIKAINNRDGPPSLVAEWVGSSAARWLGVPTPDFDIVELTSTVDVRLDENSDTLAQPGPCFGSKFVKAFGWSGDRETLEALENPEAIPAIVALDTWLRNLDRFCLAGDGSVRFNNPGNLLLREEGAARGKFVLVAIDFGYSFGGPGESRRVLRTLGIVQDDAIYGNFPAFRPYMLRSRFEAVLATLRTFGPGDADGLLAGVPGEWGLNPADRAAIADFLRERAGYVADKFEHMIWEDDRLWGTEGA